MFDAVEPVLNVVGRGVTDVGEGALNESVMGPTFTQYKTPAFVDFDLGRAAADALKMSIASATWQIIAHAAGTDPGIDNPVELQAGMNFAMETYAPGLRRHLRRASPTSTRRDPSRRRNLRQGRAPSPVYDHGAEIDENDQLGGGFRHPGSRIR